MIENIDNQLNFQCNWNPKRKVEFFLNNDKVVFSHQGNLALTQETMKG